MKNILSKGFPKKTVRKGTETRGSNRVFKILRSRNVFEAVFYVICDFTHTPVTQLMLQVGLEKERTVFLF